MTASPIARTVLITIAVIVSAGLLLYGPYFASEWYYWRTHRSAWDRAWRRVRLVHEMRNLAYRAQGYSRLQQELPARIEDMVRADAASARIVDGLAENFGRESVVAFAPQDATMASWTSIVVARHHVVLVEISRDGYVRFYGCDELGTQPDW